MLCRFEVKVQKHLKITILKKDYFVTTNENADEILKSAKLVDELIREKTKNSPSGNDEKIAIVTALHLATEVARYKKKLNEYEKKAANMILLID
jgi:cell division protein ZapA (FtsZ GTPase activity inhibitor)